MASPLKDSQTNSANNEQALCEAVEKYRALDPTELEHNHRPFADALFNLGDCYYSAKHYEDAKPCFEEALEHYRHASDLVDRIGVVKTTCYLGMTEEELGDKKQAENLFKQAINGVEVVDRDTDEDLAGAIALSQLNLGNFYSSQQSYPVSERYFKLAYQNYKIAAALDFEKWKWMLRGARYLLCSTLKIQDKKQEARGIKKDYKRFVKEAEK